MPGPLARLYATLGLDTREYDEGLGRAQKSASGFGKATDLAIGAGAAAVTGALLGTIGAAREWDTAFTGVKKTVDTTGQSVEQEAATFAKLEDQILDLSGTIPLTTTELAGLAEAGGAMGVATEDIAEFVRVTGMIGATTDVAAQDAATALGKIGNVIGLTADQYQRFADVLVLLGNKGASFESEIIAVANRLAGTASVIGLNADQLLGWSAAIADVGIEPEAAGGSFQKFAGNVQSAVLLGGTKLETFAKLGKMTAQQFEQAWATDPSAALESVIAGLSELNEAEYVQAREMAGFGSEVRIKALVDKLTGSYTKAHATLARAQGDSTAATDEFAKKVESVDGQIGLFWNRINRLAITFGETLLPPLLEVTTHLGNFATMLNDAATAFPAVTAAVVPLVTALSGLTALKFGARFLGLGPALEAGLSGAWKVAAKGSQVAIKAAGAAAGLAYQAAAFVASKFMVAAEALWIALGGPGSRVMKAVETAGLSAGGRFLIGLGKGITGAGFVILIADIVKEVLKQFGIDFGDANVAPITGSFAKSFEKRFGYSLEEAVGGATKGLSGTVETSISSEMAQVHPSLFEVRDALAEGIGGENVFSLLQGQVDKLTDALGDSYATGIEIIAKRITDEFGNIKQALANPPQLISRDDRMENQEKRQRIILRRLHQAVNVDDPWNIEYYTRAAIANDRRMAKLRGNTGMTTGEIKRKFKAMGVDVEDSWLGVRDKAKSATRQAKNAAVTNAQETATQVEGILGGMDAGAWGANLISSWATGMLGMAETVRTVSQYLAGIFASNFEAHSAPREGPLSTVNRWGEPLVDAWLGGVQKGGHKVKRAADRLAGAFSPQLPVPALAGAGGGGGQGAVVVNVHGNVYGGPAGLRQLQWQIEQAVRPTQRERRRTGLAEG